MESESKGRPDTNRRCRPAPQLRADNITAAGENGGGPSVWQEGLQWCVQLVKLSPGGSKEVVLDRRGLLWGHCVFCGESDNKAEDELVSPGMFSSLGCPQEAIQESSENGVGHLYSAR